MGNVSIAFQIHFRIISQTFLLFRLSGILGHLGHLQTRSKRSSESPMDIAQILPNHEVCFAGHKLIFKAPEGEAKAENFREALNTFILMLSHLHGGHSGYYNTV